MCDLGIWTGANAGRLTGAGPEAKKLKGSWVNSAQTPNIALPNSYSVPRERPLGSKTSNILPYLPAGRQGSDGSQWALRKNPAKTFSLSSAG